MTPTLLIFVRRVGISCIVLLGVSMLIFAIARIIPGDPARIALGPSATAESVAKLRAELRLDEPIAVQYGHFLSELAQGDLGISLYTNRPVVVDIAQFLPATLELIFVAGAMMIVIGLPLGIASARWRGTWIDNAIRMIALLGVSAPSFVWAVILMLLFAYFLPLFPIAGRISDTYSIDPVTNFLLLDTLIAGDSAHSATLPGISSCRPSRSPCRASGRRRASRAPTWWRPTTSPTSKWRAPTACRTAALPIATPSSPR